MLSKLPNAPEALLISHIFRKKGAHCMPISVKRDSMTSPQALIVHTLSIHRVQNPAAREVK
jgi:hypothetical protein